MRSEITENCMQLECIQGISYLLQGGGVRLAVGADYPRGPPLHHLRFADREAVPGFTIGVHDSRDIVCALTSHDTRHERLGTVSMWHEHLIWGQWWYLLQ